MPNKMKVVHCKVDYYEVYIGRAAPGLPQSKWANPFRMHGAKDRARVIEAYRGWIVLQPRLMKALPELKGKILGCWCSPLPCHGDVLIELVSKYVLGGEK